MTIVIIPLIQVVNIMDGCGSSYKVALNSALEFGIMYNPNKNREEALVSCCDSILPRTLALIDL